MTTLTKDQHTALLAGLDALEERARILREEGDPVSAEGVDIDYHTLHGFMRGVRLDDAPALWRDSDREYWMRDGSIHLELVADPSVTAHSRPLTFVPGTYVAIETTDEMVAVPPEHLPALIAMLQELQRRIEAGEAK